MAYTLVNTLKYYISYFEEEAWWQDISAFIQIS